MSHAPGIQASSVKFMLARRIPHKFISLDVLQAYGAEWLLSRFLGCLRRHEDLEVVQIGSIIDYVALALGAEETHPPASAHYQGHSGDN